MGADNGNGRITMRQVDEKLDAMRREIKLWIVIGLLGGQTAAGVVTSLLTSSGPVQQAGAVAHVVARLFI